MVNMSAAHEYETIVTLTATEPVSRERLEDDMFAVLDAVEEHAADIALGPVVGAHFGQSAIELAYTVLANSQAEARARADEVTERIAWQQVGDGRLERTSIQTREPDRVSMHALC